MGTKRANLTLTDNDRDRPDNHLTIIGGRQCGKTQLLIEHAVGEGIKGTSIIFECATGAEMMNTFERAQTFARLPRNLQFLAATVRANGNEAIRFTSGGRIMFGVHGRGFSRGLVADVHILDGVKSDVEGNPTVQRVIRSQLG